MDYTSGADDRCPQCGLEHFSTGPRCRRCGWTAQGSATAGFGPGSSPTTGPIPPGARPTGPGFNAPGAAPGWRPHGPMPNAGPLPPTRSSKTATVVIVVVAVIIGGVFILGIVAAIAIPSLLAARKAANESSAIGTLRTVASAEASYYSAHGAYGTPADLVRDQILAPEMAVGFGGTLDGYKYRQGKVDRSGFTFYAEPETPARGSRSFAVNEDFVIRYTKGSTSAPGTSGTPLGDSAPTPPPPPPVDRRTPVPTPPPSPAPAPSGPAPAPPPPPVSSPAPRSGSDEEEPPKPERRGKSRKEKEPESAYPPPF